MYDLGFLIYDLLASLKRPLQIRNHQSHIINPFRFAPAGR
jgi:hypothetical protein